jgi:hypothetical protein
MRGHARQFPNHFDFLTAGVGAVFFAFGCGLLGGLVGEAVDQVAS